MWRETTATHISPGGHWSGTASNRGPALHHSCLAQAQNHPTLDPWETWSSSQVVSEPRVAGLWTVITPRPGQVVQAVKYSWLWVINWIIWAACAYRHLSQPTIVKAGLCWFLQRKPFSWSSKHCHYLSNPTLSPDHHSTTNSTSKWPWPSFSDSPLTTSLQGMLFPQGEKTSPPWLISALDSTGKASRPVSKFPKCTRSKQTGLS